VNELWYNSLIFEKWENSRTHVGVVLEVFPARTMDHLLRRNGMSEPLYVGTLEVAEEGFELEDVRTIAGKYFNDPTVLFRTYDRMRAVRIYDVYV
jgi:hypothetical protein